MKHLHFSKIHRQTSSAFLILSFFDEVLRLELTLTLASANVQNNETNKPRYDSSSASDSTYQGIIFQTISYLACCLPAESPEGPG